MATNATDNKITNAPQVLQAVSLRLNHSRAMVKLGDRLYSATFAERRVDHARLTKYRQSRLPRPVLARSSVVRRAPVQSQPGTLMDFSGDTDSPSCFVRRAIFLAERPSRLLDRRYRVENARGSQPFAVIGFLHARFFVFDVDGRPSVAREKRQTTSAVSISTDLRRVFSVYEIIT